MWLQCLETWSLLSSIDRLSILLSACLEEEHRGGNTLCLVKSLGLRCVSITLLSLADSAKMWLQCLETWSLLSSIDCLSILFLACLKEEHRGGNNLCLVESLGLRCVSITFLSVADSRKMWLQFLPDRSCRPSTASQYYSPSA